MNRQRVSSSNLSSVGYDEASETLEIEFDSGSVYQYSRVPAAVYSALMSAASHGKFFNARIKNAGYRCVQVR